MKTLQQIAHIGCLLFIAATALNAQVLAVTENGDTIYVYPNGTWSYDELDEMPIMEESGLFELDENLVIDTISTHFKYASSSDKEVENANNQFVIKYNSDKWRRVPPASLNDDAEFAFEHKERDIWCVVIAEEIPIEMEALFSIAKNNMANFTGTGVEVLKAEVRRVNGSEVLRGVMRTESSGIPFLFDTYYFSNDKCSVQFTVWTSVNIWENQLEDIEELHNGFIATKE
ncbi:MAG: hypothetical protein AAGF87_05520 [Bacteroidota bacterium]